VILGKVNRTDKTTDQLACGRRLEKRADNSCIAAAAFAARQG